MQRDKFRNASEINTFFARERESMPRETMTMIDRRVQFTDSLPILTLFDDI